MLFQLQKKGQRSQRMWKEGTSSINEDRDMKMELMVEKTKFS